MNIVSDGHSTEDDKFVPDLTSSLTPAVQSDCNKTNNISNAQLGQASSSYLKTAATKENHRLPKEIGPFKSKLWQREILNDFFIKNSRPTDEEIKDLSLKTKRNEKSVKKWFYNKNHRLKKKSKTSSKHMTLSKLKTFEPF